VSNRQCTQRKAPQAVLQKQRFAQRDPEPARGEESNTRRARFASSERRADGRNSCTEAVAE
jgi:hypothetical protein